MDETTEIETPRRRLAEVVASEIGKQEHERVEDRAYEALPEAFDASEPGSVFAKRVLQRLAQESL